MVRERLGLLGLLLGLQSPCSDDLSLGCDDTSEMPLSGLLEIFGFVLETTLPYYVLCQSGCPEKVCFFQGIEKRFNALTHERNLDQSHWS